MHYLTRQERLYDLEKMTNTRDLGGYETREGRYTKAHKYIRASSPYRATKSDLKTLVDEGLKVVIDLRSTFEVKKEINPFKDNKDVDYYHINLLDMENIQVVPETVHEYKNLGGLYVYMLEACKKTIKEVFDIFIKYPYDCILFHCSAGKDRTGVISALLLDLAGCHEYDIVKDYSESYENNKEINEYLASQMEDKETTQYLDSSPEYMMIFLDYLYENYGSSYNYLRSIGISEEDLDDLKEDFLL